MLKDKRAVIFDLDGTLIDSMWVWAQVDVDFLHKYGYDVPDDLHEAIEGMSFLEGAHYFKGRFSIPLTVNEIYEEWHRMAYDFYVNEVPLKSGAFEFIKKLKALGIKTAIATSNSRRLTEQILRVQGVLEDFDAIVTSDEVEKGKPDPQIYLQAAEKIAVNPEDCLVFEDVAMGILAGKSAGMTVCAIRDKFSEPQWEKKVTLADYAIEDYTQIL